MKDEVVRYSDPLCELDAGVQKQVRIDVIVESHLRKALEIPEVDVQAL